MYVCWGVWRVVFVNSNWHINLKIDFFALCVHYYWNQRGQESVDIGSFFLMFTFSIWMLLSRPREKLVCQLMGASEIELLLEKWQFDNYPVFCCLLFPFLSFATFWQGYHVDSMYHFVVRILPRNSELSFLLCCRRMLYICNAIKLLDGTRE